MQPKLHSSVSATLAPFGFTNSFAWFVKPLKGEEEMKKLVRDRSKGKISGLCAGIAEYAQIDVTVVRVAVLALVIFSGVLPGTLFYLIASLITPAEGEVPHA